MIYIIYKKNDDNFYLGKTNNIKNRMYLHKYHSKTKHHMKIYNYINCNGGWEQWNYKVISEDLNDTETEWYHILKPTLNTNICGRDYKGWYQANKEHHKEYMRNYMRKYYKNKKETTLNGNVSF